MPAHIQKEIAEKENNEETIQDNEQLEIFGGGFDDDFGVQNNHSLNTSHGGFIPQFSSQDHLISTPQQVSHLNINYAKTAKFVDVKALKNKIWNSLSVDVDNPPNTKNQKPKKKMIQDSQFSSLITSLNPEDSSHEEPISIPYAFICLLHLANEKGLDINQEKNDLHILPPKAD